MVPTHIINILQKLRCGWNNVCSLVKQRFWPAFQYSYCHPLYSSQIKPLNFLLQRAPVHVKRDFFWYTISWHELLTGSDIDAWIFAQPAEPVVRDIPLSWHLVRPKWTTVHGANFKKTFIPQHITSKNLQNPQKNTSFSLYLWTIFREWVTWTRGLREESSIENTLQVLLHHVVHYLCFC